MLKEAFYLFYGGVTMLNIVACFYLLFRRGNAIAPDITSSVRLRRWTAAFFAVSALSHLWNLPVFFLTSGDNVKLCYLVGALLDCMTVGPLAIVILFAMLQDRRRPLWLVAAMFAPTVIIMALCVAYHSDALMPILYSYAILLIIGLIIYVVCAVRQYGRWLRDNYSDLEHKEVWQSMVLLGVILLSYVSYTLTTKGTVYIYALHTISLVLVIYLPWRVETLSELSPDHAAPTGEGKGGGEKADDIGLLLKQQCEDTQLFLQHDLTLSHLAHALGTNRTYLGMYFSRQGTTYNAYINDLRIDCFVRLVREANAAQRPFTAQELAAQSGYRSYRTFSVAFRERKGQSVTAWMNEEGA